MAKDAFVERVEALDSQLFSFVDAQSSEWDRRALLALQSAAADICGQFTYLEIGSYLGGSLQALLPDPRCGIVISIDPRLTVAPDTRGGGWDYEDNTTDHMLEALRAVPDADMSKLITLETTTEALSPSELPAKPDVCFIDGEHTPRAVTRDAHFCADALRGSGVIAFHDYFLIGSGIRRFLRERRREISFLVAFNLPSYPPSGGGVLALELGDSGFLGHPAIHRAIGSSWHLQAWKLANRPRRTALPLLLTCATMPAIDSFIAIARHGFQEFVGREANGRRARSG